MVRQNKVRAGPSRIFFCQRRLFCDPVSAQRMMHFPPKPCIRAFIAVYAPSPPPRTPPAQWAVGTCENACAPPSALFAVVPIVRRGSGGGLVPPPNTKSQKTYCINLFADTGGTMVHFIYIYRKEISAFADAMPISAQSRMPRRGTSARP